jgi:hypothetical protein
MDSVPSLSRLVMICALYAAGYPRLPLLFLFLQVIHFSGLVLFLASIWRLLGRFSRYGVSSSGSSGQGLWCIVVTKVLHLIGSHEVVVHATLEIALAQHAALVIVHSAVGAQAAQVRLHNVLAFGIVVERE